jgi:hypothetical protein
MLNALRRSGGAFPRVVACLLASAAAALALGTGVAGASVVIDNGTIELGVNDRGNLNYAQRGVYYKPTGFDGTFSGCPCEGWGAGNFDSDPTKMFSGYANAQFGDDSVASESFTSTPTTATSVSSVGSGRLLVTHEFAPFTGSDNLFEVRVTLKNASTETLGDVRYTRVMDWDIEPTATNEFVTIRRGTTSALRFSSDEGFKTGDPFEPRGDAGDPATYNTDFTDIGPQDHGALFDFGFGALAPGESTTFLIFYGAAATTAMADATVSAAGAEAYSYGKPTNADGVSVNDDLNTFIFAFRGLGGAPVIPPTLTLTPSSGSGTTDAEHTVTATVTDSADSPVEGSALLFSVSGANSVAATPKTTGADGKATFSYTAANEGQDTIAVCIDGDGDGACSETEVTTTAAYSAADSTAPETSITAGPADGDTITTDQASFAFSADDATAAFECKLDDGDFAACGSPYEISALSDGAHTVEVRAKDTSGNADTTPATRTFTVDTTAPETTITKGPQPGSESGTQTFEFASEAGSTYTCSIDGAAAVGCQSPHTLTGLAPGQHTIRVVATDAQGNADQSPATLTFAIAETPAARRPVIVLPPQAPAVRCGSKRRFRIRLRPAHTRLASAVVKVNGKRVETGRNASGRLTAVVNLIGLPKAAYKVEVVARAKNGRTYRETRTYKVC